MPSVHQADLAYIGVACLAVWAAGKAATQPMTVYLTANCVLTGSIEGIVEAYSSGLPKDTVDKAILVASALLVAILVGVQIATKGLPLISSSCCWLLLVIYHPYSVTVSV